MLLQGAGKQESAFVFLGLLQLRLLRLTFQKGA